MPDPIMKKEPSVYPRKHRQAWEEMGEMDPLWAILSVPGKKRRGWDIDSFFRTGDREVQELLAISERLSRPSERDAALDFGFGVGRVSRALSRHFGKCYGVDISASMVTKAREFNRAFPNCEFLVNASSRLDMFETGTLDLVYANLVLMHLPRMAMIESYLSEFIRVLKKDGLLVFQVPSHVPLRFRLDPRRKLYGLLRSIGLRGSFLYRIGLVPITMRAAPEAHILALLQAHRATALEIQRDRDPATGIDNRVYFVTH